MESRSRALFLLSLAFLFFLAYPLKLALGATNPGDVSALQNMFTSLNSPGQLTSWTANGGDPCGQSWKGVRCSGNAVTQLNLAGLGLSGQLGYNMAQLTSLVVLDLHNNNISGIIPYSLPPNVYTLNLGMNSFANNLAYSISTMTNLNYLNVSHNHMTGNLVDVFSKLGNLSVIDLSFNTMTGSLPQSFSALYSLASLYLENNQFTGSLNVLANLQLQDLDVENNQFSGWVPASFNSIPNLKDGGNSFSSSPAPPPPPYTPPPPKSSGSQGRKSNSASSSKSSEGSDAVLNGGAIAGIVIACILGVIVASLIAVYFHWKPCKNVNDEEKQQSSAGVRGPLIPPVTKVVKERPEAIPMSSSSEATLKPPPSEKYKTSAVDKLLGRKSSSKRAKIPIAAATYSVADLQLATDSFSQENLIGEGTLGRVYRAKLPDGKLLAVKKFDTTSFSSVQNDEGFTEVVANISRLRHANIAELVGYCIEHGQHLLVYEYFSEGTLSDALHGADEMTKRELTWNARVKIALGAARALEYLHEVCQPSVVHKNLKSANLLMDDEFNPHLSDCGIAAFSPNQERQVSTQMLSSFGYSAPEYTMSGIYTWKSDVYSFGVVMLELLTGRKPLDSTRQRSEQSLVRWAVPQLHDIDALAKMVDPALNGIYPAKSLSSFADIIALCVQPEPEFRPPMSEVVQSLVRLMQRASIKQGRSNEEQNGSDAHDPSDLSF